MTDRERSDGARNTIGVACKVAARFRTAAIVRGIWKRLHRRPEFVIVGAPVVDVAERNNVLGDNSEDSEGQM